MLAKKNCINKKNGNVHGHGTRRAGDMHRWKGSSRSPLANVAEIFNKIPERLRVMPTEIFKKALKKILIEKEYYELGDFMKDKEWT